MNKNGSQGPRDIGEAQILGATQASAIAHLRIRMVSDVVVLHKFADNDVFVLEMRDPAIHIVNFPLVQVS